jgi:hypothetical protein
MYLHGGGAIGPSDAIAGVQVSLPAALSRLELPEPPSGGAEMRAVAASLRLLDVGPDTITLPLVSSVYRAPLGPSDFSVHFWGRSGVFKTAVCAVGQQHFGAQFHARQVPLSWFDTANYIGEVCFAAKDALLLVDDYTPTGARADIERYHKAGDRVFRSQGNAAGRGRMGRDGSLRLSKPPRGLLISTGEEIPNGFSVRARMLAVEVPKNAICPSYLSDCQKDADAGRYAEAMASYVKWIAIHYAETVKTLPAKLVDFRRCLAQDGKHRRTVDLVANLLVGFHTFVSFACEIGVLTGEQAGQLVWERGVAALRRVADQQDEHQRVSEPNTLFLEAVRASIAGGRAHLVGANGRFPEPDPRPFGWHVRSILGSNEWHPNGPCIGCVEGLDVFLDSRLAFEAAQAVAVAGEVLSINRATLHRRLHESGHLLSTDPARGTLTVRKAVAGRRPETLHLKLSALFETVADPLNPVPAILQTGL